MENEEPAIGTGPVDSAPATATRRRFLVVGGKAVLAAACVGATFAALQSIYPPIWRWLRWPRSGPLQAIAIGTLPPGQWKRVEIEAGGDAPKGQKTSIWIYRDRDQPETFRILSAVCTHAGCTVNWRADRKLFVCPCHGGTFDAEGNRQGGPPRRALASVGYQVKDGQLLVRSPDV
jgi:cytochrome b6-f complex iron-sulfur subunit